MRRNHIGAIVASSALAAATILGGASVANASVGSGSLFPGSAEEEQSGGIDLAINPGKYLGDLTGTLADNTGDDRTITECTVFVASAEDVQESQETGTPLAEEDIFGQSTSADESFNDEGVWEWIVDLGYGHDFDGQYGAYADCQYESEDAFAYEPEDDASGSLGELVGSLDLFGSLEGLSDS